MRMHMSETTATFLAKHELSSYTAAFDEHGWDSLPALQDISDDDLKQLVTDVAMKSGHAARLLRTALGRNGRERRVENPTHLLEAWDCIWSHGALAQARAIQVAASSLWAAGERRLLPGGGHGTMLRHDGAAQREEEPTVERQLARPTAV
jgi:hypothetical protein